MTITNLTNDIIPLTEKREPLLQHRLAAILQIVPFWHTFFGLEGGEGEGARRVFAREDVVAAARRVGFVLAYVEDGAFDRDEGRFVVFRACRGGEVSVSGFVVALRRCLTIRASSSMRLFCRWP